MSDRITESAPDLLHWQSFQPYVTSFADSQFLQDRDLVRRDTESSLSRGPRIFSMKSAVESIVTRAYVLSKAVCLSLGSYIFRGCAHYRSFERKPFLSIGEPSKPCLTCFQISSHVCLETSELGGSIKFLKFSVFSVMNISLCFPSAAVNSF
jgi:hypothetical protein